MGLFGWGSGRSVGELPPRFLPTAIVCEQQSALIFGGARGEHLPGDPKLFDREAVAFKVFRDGSEMKRLAIGSGLALDASQPSHGALYVVRTEWAPDAPEKGYLVRSRDGGESWQAVDAAPHDIIGVEFESEQRGYVWSSRVVYRTEDGGASWSSVDAPGLLPRGAPRPVVDSSGALWVAVGHGPGWDPGNNAIARVLPDLRVQAELVNASFRVWEIDVSKDATAWLLVEGPDTKRLRLMRLSPGQGTPSLVAELPEGLPKYLRVLGSEIVVLLSETGSDDPRRFLMVSRDLGASWKKVQPPEERVREACALGADKIWLVGTSGAVYPPG